MEFNERKRILLQKTAIVMLAFRVVALVIDRIIHFSLPEELARLPSYSELEIPTSLSLGMTIVVLIGTLIIHAISIYGLKKENLGIILGIFALSVTSFAHSFQNEIPLEVVRANFVNACSSQFLEDKISMCLTILTCDQIIQCSFWIILFPLEFVLFFYIFEIRSNRNTIAGEALYQVQVFVDLPSSYLPEKMA